MEIIVSDPPCLLELMEYVSIEQEKKGFEDCKVVCGSMAILTVLILRPEDSG